ncbi:MAG TPA: cobyric acid synthase [Dissulfurispiraceae bacterium]|nr:cobyric acid synthase [Dissulfurispiraceae bacterium]
MSKALMVQGTGSGAGKSLLVTAFCRILKDRGLNVAPFKSQNMALNSFVTADGGEIGRAQALQAEAARLKPTIDMNPILLKAQGESGCQVIIHGRVHSSMQARQYYAFKESAWKAAKASFDVLSKRHDLIIIEGAGSPAEINLMDVDIVNMKVAKYAKAPVLLVGDIDRGGVFASLYGTVKLLGRDRRCVRGYVINKFRGDIDILKPGLDIIHEKTAIPVIGVLPYFDCSGLSEEDGLALTQKSDVRSQKSGVKEVKIVVVRLKYISNFTDFDALMHENDVEVVFSDNPADIENSDIVIIPGTKNTVKDLLFLLERGLDLSIKKAHAKGIMVVGLCGGYQMLGSKIYDPERIESTFAEMDGLGLLDIETSFENIKNTCQTDAVIMSPQLEDLFGIKSSGEEYRLRGYEIHMGTSSGDIGLFRLKRLAGDSEEVLDGSMKGCCWGTYLHGIFDNDSFRRTMINSIRAKKGLNAINDGLNYAMMKDAAVDRLASMVNNNIDMEFIGRLLKL